MALVYIKHWGKHMETMQLTPWLKKHFCTRVNNNKSHTDKSIMNPHQTICIHWNPYNISFSLIYYMCIYFKNDVSKKAFSSPFVCHCDENRVQILQGYQRKSLIIVIEFQVFFTINILFHD